MLEQNVFEKFNVPDLQIKELSQELFKIGNNNKNYESIYYALYFAIKYDFEIEKFNADDAIESTSCLFKLFAFLYFKKRADKIGEKNMKDHAKNLILNDDDFNRNWLFVYESLTQNELKDNWVHMKKCGVSFVKYEK